MVAVLVVKNKPFKRLNAALGDEGGVIWEVELRQAARATSFLMRPVGR
jgi:hypothetical protein